ncbi:MAG: polysaccharide deacetylase family protein [Bacteroidales bacterium]|nr:polysaccharide deacetylase family protein [Bacteroidales bacterium]
MSLSRPCFIAPLIFPEALFRVKTSEKTLCLTFDDGPDPQSTPVILNILDKMNVRALFFCSGYAAEKHPELVDKIRQRGHVMGNHGYRHLNGYHTPASDYFSNAARASEFTSDYLFRPPYGKITIRQYRQLKKSFRIIFWDVMAYDFDKNFGAERSLSLLNRKIRPGSVIVLHDKPESTCMFFLKEFIETSLRRGYRFETEV